MSQDNANEEAGLVSGKRMSDFYESASQGTQRFLFGFCDRSFFPQCLDMIVAILVIFIALHLSFPATLVPAILN